MRLLLVACLGLALLACKDPYEFEPGDPTKPDPPAAPVLTYPANGWMSDDYGYPQDVSFGWQQVSGAQFCQLEVYRDSLLRIQDLVYSNERVTQPSLTGSFSTYGSYYWRVRAASRSWNNYTAWSAPFRFGLPNPAK